MMLKLRARAGAEQGTLIKDVGILSCLFTASINVCFKNTMQLVEDGPCGTAGETSS